MRSPPKPYDHCDLFVLIRALRSHDPNFNLSHKECIAMVTINSSTVIQPQSMASTSAALSARYTELDSPIDETLSWPRSDDWRA